MCMRASKKQLECFDLYKIIICMRMFIMCTICTVKRNGLLDDFITDEAFCFELLIVIPFNASTIACSGIVTG